jgi:hypothetical protein
VAVLEAAWQSDWEDWGGLEDLAAGLGVCRGCSRCLHRAMGGGSICKQKTRVPLVRFVGEKGEVPCDLREYARRDINYDYAYGHGLEGGHRQEQQQMVNSPRATQDMSEESGGGDGAEGLGEALRHRQFGRSWRNNKTLLKQAASQRETSWR